MPGRKQPGLQSSQAKKSLASPARQAKPARHKAHQAGLASHARLKSQAGWMWGRAGLARLAALQGWHVLQDWLDSKD